MTLALLVGSMITGRERMSSEQAVVLVENGIIVACSPAGEVAVPANADLIEAPGHTLLPGMIDCHVHIMERSNRLEDRLMTRPSLKYFHAVRHLKATLRAGFTTVRDAGGADPGVREAVEGGIVEGPRILVSGSVGQTGTHLQFRSPTGHTLDMGTVPLRICDGPDEARKATREVMCEGFDFVKISTTGGVSSPQSSPYGTELTVEEIRTICETAANAGGKVIAHAVNAQGVKNAVRGGVWSVEHGSILDAEAVRALSDSGTFLVPTLAVGCWALAAGPSLGFSKQALERAKFLTKAQSESCRAAVAGGVRVAVGTDAFGERHGMNGRELQHLVDDIGLTPLQAIVAATYTGAGVCGLGDRVGTIEVGKIADLVLVDGDPLADISVLQDHERLTVLKEGKLVTLGSALRDTVALKPLWSSF